MLWCAAAVFLAEGQYEKSYVSQYHQGMAETVMRWNRVSLDLGGNPMMSFGIHVINPKLSPTYWVGYIVDSDKRIPVQAAFQCVVMLLIAAALLRASGARRSEAFAIGAVAMGYSWIPSFSSGAITANATEGLFWQEGAIAALLAFLFFCKVGSSEGRLRLWPPLGLALTIVWFCVSLPYLIPFFTLSTALLCVGALCAVETRKELLQKTAFSAGIIAILLLVGFHNYVLNIFAYTPQMFYRVVADLYFAPLSFRNETLLLGAGNLGGARIFLFFGLAAIGAVGALRYGNRFARRLVYAGVVLEALVHSVAAVNIAFKVSPLTFLYVELMGISIVAILAGIGVWTLLRVASAGIEKALAAAVKRA